MSSLAFLRMTTTPVFTTFFCLLFISMTSAQPAHEWSRRMGGSGGAADQCEAIAFDPSGNVLITGHFEGSAVFFGENDTINVNSLGGPDIFIAKYSPTGDLLWLRNVGGSFDDGGTDITTDASGNVYVTGFFRSLVDFSTDGIPHILDADSDLLNGSDIFIAKYTPDGDLLWAHQFGGEASDQGTGITIDAAGDLVLCGQFRDSVNFNTSGGEDFIVGTPSFSTFFAKFTTDAELIWVKGMGNAGVAGPEGIATDSNNNIFLSGTYNLSVNLDPESGPDGFFESQAYDGFIAKYNAMGEYEWGYGFGSPSWEFCRDIAVDAEGNAFIVGNFFETMDMDPSEEELLITSNAASDVFLAKYSSSGESLWAISLGAEGSDEGRGITTDGAGNVYITGAFSHTVDFDPSENTANVTSNGFFDVFVAKYSADGEYLWAFEAGSPNSCYGNTVEHDGGNLLCVGGYFSGPANFDPLDENGFLEPTNGGFDAFLAQYLDCSAQVEEITASICAGETYILGNTVFTSPGIYALDYTNEFGCEVSAMLELNVVVVDAEVELSGTDIIAVQSDAEYQWYQCDEGLSMLSGEINQAFTPSASGSYAVEIVIGDCSVLSQCLPFVITSLNGIEPSFTSDFWVYPNPAVEFTTVRSDHTKPVEMRILDVTGRQNTPSQIIAPGENIVSTVDLVPGIYVFQFIDVDRVAAISVLVK